MASLPIEEGKKKTARSETMEREKVRMGYEENEAEKTRHIS